MAKLTIKMVNGDVSDHFITPTVEYAFEQNFKVGFYKAMLEEPQQTYVYWMAWKCLLIAGAEIKPFGEAFISTLAKVEVTDEDPNL
jgi:hypothetical protein